MMKRLGIILCSLFLYISVFAQFNKGAVSADRYYTELPFAYEYDKIVVEATFGGVSGRYLFDTGALCVLFKDSLNSQSFVQLDEVAVGDANGQKEKAQLVEMPTIKLGDIVYTNIPTIYVEMFDGPFQCLGYDGIIGSNLLRFGAFKVDWQNQKIIIADSYQTLGFNKEDGVKLKVNKSQSSPFVKCKINNKNIKWVLIDTGSGDGFELNATSAKWLKRRHALGKPAYSSSGTSAHGAWGAGDHSTQYFSDITLSVGNTVFENAQLESGQGKSKIGMKLLELDDFAIDYPQKRLFFEPDSSNVNLLIESFGIDIVLVEEEFIVNGVWDDTQAFKSGIEKGDVIVDILGLGFNQMAACDALVAMKQFAKDKDELTFLYRKKGQDNVWQVKLRRIVFD